MPQMARRTFLRAVGGVTAAAAGFLYPGVADAARRAAGSSRTIISLPQGPDPTYAGGEVISKTPNGVVLATPTATRAVRIPSQHVVWKELDGTLDVIQLHDWVDVKGEPQTDGSLLALSGWIFVNIGRRNGVIEAISERGARIRNDNGDLEQIEYSTRLEIIDSEDESALPNGWKDLSPGTSVGAVGLRLPDGGFRATRIWKW